VRTGLTPSRYYTAYPLYFLLCRTLGRHGRRPSDTVRSLTRHDRHHQHPRCLTTSARRTAHLYNNRHTTDWSHRARTRPGHGQKDSQGRRPRPAPCSTPLGDRNRQLFSLGPEETTLLPTCACNPSLLKSIKGGRSTHSETDGNTRELPLALTTSDIGTCLNHPYHAQGLGSFSPSLALAQACTPNYKHPGAR